MANKNPRHKFEKGNKIGGRKPLDPAFKALLEEHTVEALNTVIELMKNKNTAAVVRLNAASFIIERVYGKANQPLSNPDGTPITFNLVNYAK